MTITRRTQQREAIRRAFAGAGRPLSPQEALAQAQTDAPRLGIATVYRTIKTLVEDGELSVVQLPGEPQRYELSGLAHHHHFRCRRCDKVFDVPGCGLHRHAAAPRGFRVEDHEIWLIGLCNRCVRAGAA